MTEEKIQITYVGQNSGQKALATAKQSKFHTLLGGHGYKNGTRAGASCVLGQNSGKDSHWKAKLTLKMK